MYPVFVIDIASFLASLTAIIVLLKGWSRTLLHRETKLLITGLVTLALFHHLSNILEWSAITNVLDVYEDYIEILLPIWWGLIFYSFLQQIAARDLHQSEERYRNLFENTGTATFVVEEDMTISQINAKCEELIGYTRDKIEGKMKTLDFVPGNEVERIKKYHLGRREQDGHYPSQYELTLIDKHGDTRNAIIQVGMIPGTKKTINSIIDITPLRRAEEELRESERRYRTLFESANDAIFIMKEDTFVECNPKTLEMFGCTYEQIIGKQPFIFSPSNQPDGSDSRKKAIEKIRSAFENKTQLFEWRHTKYDGTPFDAQVSLNMVKLKTGSHLQAIVRDITERKRAEQDLKKSEKQLRSLAHRLQEVEEAERKALARELHDSVGQNMTALNINLNILRTQLPLELLEKVGPRLEDSMNLVDETTERIRDVMAELRPSVLDDYGLVATLRWYGKRFTERTGVSVHLHEDETLSRLPETVESACFRIAQEALTNIAKHADATEVVLIFEEINGILRLAIADNGKGFDPIAVSKSGNRKGWGILNMQERAQALGGQVQVESEPGKGTKILIEMRK